MTDQSRRIAGGGATPILPKKSAASEQTTHGRPPDRKSPASEAAPDEIRTCYMRHGDRVGIGMTVLMLEVRGDGARLVEDRRDGQGKMRATCDAGSIAGSWTLSDGVLLQRWHDRFTAIERAGRTAIRLSHEPSFATWKVEIDADPAMPLMLNARTSEVDDER